MTGRKELSPRQMRFASEYLIDCNATQAAIRAGYSEKGASVQGTRLLANANVRAKIDRLQELKENRVEVTQDWIVEQLVEVHGESMKRSAHGAFHPGAANKSLELLGKHTGMFREERQGTGDVNIQINMHPHGDDKSDH